MIMELRFQAKQDGHTVWIMKEERDWTPELFAAAAAAVGAAIFSAGPDPGTPRSVSLSPRADPDRFSQIPHAPSPSQQVTPSEIQIGTSDIGGYAKSRSTE